VTPILVVLAAGYVFGIFVLLIERCAHGNILKCWPRGSVRRWRQNEYWRLLYNYQKSQLSSPLHVQENLFTYYFMILFKGNFSSVSLSVIRSVTFRLAKRCAILLLTPQSTQSAKLIFAVERRKFLTDKWKRKLH